MSECPKCSSVNSKVIGSLYYECLDCGNQYSWCPLCTHSTESPIEFKEFVWRCLKCGSELATFPSSMKCPHCGVTFERQLRDSRNFVSPNE